MTVHFVLKRPVLEWFNDSYSTDLLFPSLSNQTVSLIQHFTRPMDDYVHVWVSPENHQHLDLDLDMLRLGLRNASKTFLWFCYIDAFLKRVKC